VVTEGLEVEALVRSVDPEAQRMSLSITLLAPKPEAAAKDQAEPEPAPAPPAARKKPSKPLMGGLERPAGGDRFGLKW